MRKRIAAIGLAGGLAAGGAAGFALGAPSLVGAQEDSTTESAPTSEALANKIDERLREALAPLVEDGTIDDGQLDAVVDTLREAMPERRHGGGKHARMGQGLDSAATVLGIESDALRDALRDGQTIAEIAAEQGVDPQAVIDAQVAEATERLDEKVADGTIDQATADERLAQLTERITSFVNEGPAAGPGHRHGGPAAPIDSETN